MLLVLKRLFIEQRRVKLICRASSTIHKFSSGIDGDVLDNTEKEKYIEEERRRMEALKLKVRHNHL